MFENQELERMVVAAPLMSKRSLILRVLELARDAQCETCARGIACVCLPSGKHEHIYASDSWPCKADSIRDLMKVKP